MGTSASNNRDRFNQPAARYTLACVVGIFDMCRRANPDRPFEGATGREFSALYKLWMYAFDVHCAACGTCRALPDYSNRGN